MFSHSPHWINSVKDFLDAMGAQLAQPESIATVESIREVMLAAVGQTDAGKTLAPKVRLTCRIGACQDAKGLWYLRSEIMQLLSASHGEREARLQMDAISALFRGLLPESLHPRQAFLQDGSRAGPGRR